MGMASSWAPSLIWQVHRDLKPANVMLSKARHLRPILGRCAYYRCRVEMLRKARAAERPAHGRVLLLLLRAARAARARTPPCVPRLASLPGRLLLLCYAVLCCGMPCYAMLCYAMLCYASPLVQAGHVKISDFGISSQLDSTNGTFLETSEPEHASEQQRCAEHRRCAMRVRPAI